MNKILFNFLIVGLSLATVQGTSAVRTTAEKERDMDTTPRTQTKQRTQKRTPVGPCKPHDQAAIAFQKNRALTDPKFHWDGRTTWFIGEYHPSSTRIRSNKSS